jgi:hypothetical protein
MATTLDVQWFFPLLFVTGLAAGWVNAITGGGVLGAPPVMHKGAGFVRHLYLYLIVVITLLLTLLYERVAGMG